MRVGFPLQMSSNAEDVSCQDVIIKMNGIFMFPRRNDLNVDTCRLYGCVDGTKHLS